MPKRKEPEKFADKGDKDSWHLYGLQKLAPNKFATAVSNILGGKHTLVTTRVGSKTSAWELR